ncbi:BnaA07g08000D [Brassica napus]|uniref:(rape) hypothetical protein n=1 Tax=Brassica napus TaxID=3708 RepID=A0A078I368_BRANA|nr:unnamed protein product [Brassica napus]CDY44316.1 BnaA07g08000D [Brassica napus]
MAVPRKRKHSGDETLAEKRQKKTIEASKFAEPEKSFTALIRLRETKADSKVTRLIHENTAWRIRDHDTKTKEPGRDKIEKQNHGFKDLIAKAREKLQEKRQFDDRNTDIASQRIAARLALDQIVETDDDFDDHLKYHTELQNLGCHFIRDQVSCLKMFSLLSRNDYDIDSQSWRRRNSHGLVNIFIEKEFFLFYLL